jgi:nickel transport protein
MGLRAIAAGRMAGVLVLIVSLSLFLGVLPAEAHRVTVFAWVDGDTVHTESKFPGGREVNEGKIAVFDNVTGEKLLEGQTDAQGAFSFPIPRRTALRIELLAGMGHKSEWIVPAEEIGAAAKSAPVSPAPAVLPPPPAPASGQDMEAVLERVLDRKLQPLVRMVVDLRQQGPTLKDVFGGIGYIFGLVGVGAYFHYRRKSRELDRR